MGGKMKKYKPCKHCGYLRKRQLVSGSSCPRCGYRPLGLCVRLRRAWRAFHEQPYQPRPKAVMATIEELKEAQR